MSRKIWKKSCEKHLTIFEIVVSLHRRLILNKTTTINQIIVTTKKQRAMENKTIKGIEVIAYKGMEFNMTCKGIQ